jgi:hypothetical protein
MVGVWALEATRVTFVPDVLGLGWGLLIVVLAAVSAACGVVAMSIGSTLLLRKRHLAARVLGGLLVAVSIGVGGLAAVATLWMGAWASTDYWWDLGTTSDGRHLVVQEQGFNYRWAQLGELHGIGVTVLDGQAPIPDGVPGLGGNVHLADHGTRLRWTGDGGGISVDTDPAQ